MNRATLAFLVVGILAACEGEKQEEPQHFLFTKAPFAAPAPVDTGAEACELYQAQSCSAGTLRQCDTYDVGARQFVTADPLTHRALLADRWNQLHFSPDGQDCKRELAGTIAPDADEATWSAPEAFEQYAGLADAAIWTGTALNAYVLRYLETGAEVDYQRVEKKTRQLLTMLEITGIPGYLARAYYYLVPDGASKNSEHLVYTQSRADAFQSKHWSQNLAGPLDAVPDLPELFKTGYTDAQGVHWTGETRYQGSPTIDQYSGVTTSFLAAWSVLRDQGIKDRMAYQLGCYLKRMRRIEVINIQKNPRGPSMISAFLDGANSQFDPTDPQLDTLDRIVLYVIEQPNELNQETFDRSCPPSIQMEPSRIIDLASRTHEIDLIGLVLDLDGKKSLRPAGIDHYYAPNVRGYDAVQLMFISALLFHMTGDEMYRTFFEQELVGNLNTLGIADTWAAVIPPKWCRKWYTEHISFPPMWAFANLLADGELKDRILKTVHDEVWLKDLSLLKNVKFSLMYGGLVPARLGGGQQEAIEEATQALRAFGGNGGALDTPRRNYSTEYDTLVGLLPEGINAECPSQATVDLCETGPKVLGIQLAGWDITSPCTGAANECVMGNGECAQKRASAALPPMLRTPYGYQWQGDPYELGSSQSGTAMASGLDVFEPYWLARFYGALPEAEGLVLGWKPIGSCP